MDDALKNYLSILCACWLRTFNFVAPVTVVTVASSHCLGVYRPLSSELGGSKCLFALSPLRSTAENCVDLVSSVTASYIAILNSGTMLSPASIGSLRSLGACSSLIQRVREQVNKLHDCDSNAVNENLFFSRSPLLPVAPISSPPTCTPLAPSCSARTWPWPQSADRSVKTSIGIEVLQRHKVVFCEWNRLITRPPPYGVAARSWPSASRRLVCPPD